MVGMNTQRAKAQDTTPDKWPADIGEQMAAVHRIYPIVETADPKQLLKFVEASDSTAD